MILRQQTRTVSRGAFTLMEVLVVVAILVVLAGTGGVIFFQYKAESDRKAAKLQCDTLEKVCEIYRNDHNSPPESLQVLVEEHKLEPKALIDPWGQPYHYDPEGAHHNGLKVDVWCERNGEILGNW